MSFHIGWVASCRKSTQECDSVIELFCVFFFFFSLSLKETCERGLVNSPGGNAKAFVTKITHVDALENHSSTYIFFKILYTYTVYINTGNVVYTKYLHTFNLLLFPAEINTMDSKTPPTFFTFFFFFHTNHDYRANYWLIKTRCIVPCTNYVLT